MLTSWSFHKSPRGLGSESFWRAEHLEVPGWWHPRRVEKLHTSSPIPCSMLPFIDILCKILQNKQINFSVSLSSVRCSSKLTKPKEEIVGTPTWRQRVITSRAPDRKLVSRGVRAVLKTEPPTWIELENTQLVSTAMLIACLVCGVNPYTSWYKSQEKTVFLHNQIVLFVYFSGIVYASIKELCSFISWSLFLVLLATVDDHCQYPFLFVYKVV